MNLLLPFVDSVLLLLHTTNAQVMVIIALIVVLCMRDEAEQHLSTMRRQLQRCTRCFHTFSPSSPSTKQLLDVFSHSQRREITPEALVRAVCEYDQWCVPSAPTVAEEVDGSTLLQVALLQVATAVAL
jgi:hypothetical protein